MFQVNSRTGSSSSEGKAVYSAIPANTAPSPRLPPHRSRNQPPPRCLPVTWPPSQQHLAPLTTPRFTRCSPRSFLPHWLRPPPSPHTPALGPPPGFSTSARSLGSLALSVSTDAISCWCPLSGHCLPPAPLCVQSQMRRLHTPPECLPGARDEARIPPQTGSLPAAPLPANESPDELLLQAGSSFFLLPRFHRKFWAPVCTTYLGPVRPHWQHPSPNHNRGPRIPRRSSEAPPRSGAGVESPRVCAPRPARKEILPLLSLRPRLPAPCPGPFLRFGVTSRGPRPTARCVLSCPAW